MKGVLMADDREASAGVVVLDADGAPMGYVAEVNFDTKTLVRYKSKLDDKGARTVVQDDNGVPVTESISLGGVRTC